MREGQENKIGVYNKDPQKSAQPCGCDEGAGWECEACKIRRQGSRIQKTPDGGEILVVRAAKEGLQGPWVGPGDVIHVNPQTDIAFSAPQVAADPPEADICGSRVFGDSAKGRKAAPIFTGVLMYFPDALAEVARVSKKGNDQHNPGEPLHWAREKSTDQMDTTTRHMVDHGTGFVRDSDGGYHLAKAAWRILAELQLTIERERQ